jgi:hypothetical protein
MVSFLVDLACVFKLNSLSRQPAVSEAKPLRRRPSLPIPFRQCLGLLQSTLEAESRLAVACGLTPSGGASGCLSSSRLPSTWGRTSDWAPVWDQGARARATRAYFRRLRRIWQGVGEGALWM